MSDTEMHICGETGGFQEGGCGEEVEMEDTNMIGNTSFCIGCYEKIMEEEGDDDWCECSFCGTELTNEPSAMVNDSCVCLECKAETDATTSRKPKFVVVKKAKSTSPEPEPLEGCWCCGKV